MPDPALPKPLPSAPDGGNATGAGVKVTTGPARSRTVGVTARPPDQSPTPPAA